MPSHIPRNEPSRKKEQLLNCSEYLRLAIFHNKPQSQIEKRAEKYRLAQISLLKARIHTAKERDIDGESNLKIQKLEQEMENWTQKEIADIISEFKTSKGIN